MNDLNDLPTTKVVGIHYTGYWNQEFLKECIDELKKIPIYHSLGVEATPLQKLAYDVLKQADIIARWDE